MRYRIIGMGLAACSAALTAHAETIRYAAVLNSQAEVPAVTAAGKGSVSAELDTTTRTLRYRLTYSGLTGAANGAHFHGPAGPRANAPHQVVIGMDEDHDMAGMPGMSGAHAMLASPLAGSAILTDAQVADLEAGKWYVNVHTKAHPDGEIRGQLLPAK